MSMQITNSSNNENMS